MHNLSWEKGRKTHLHLDCTVCTMYARRRFDRDEYCNVDMSGMWFEPHSVQICTSVDSRTTYQSRVGDCSHFITLTM
jgi:hypothetical protein